MTKFLALAILLFTNPAFAIDQEELEHSRDVIREQLRRLDKFGDKSCPEEWAKYYSGKSLRISLFYGYENFDDITSDRVHSRAFEEALRRKCSGNIAACGFEVSGRGWNKVELRREIDGFPVTVVIHSTSVSETESENNNFGKQQWAQYASSQNAWKEFFAALRESDVVFYDGHSRLGAGLGFQIESFGQDAFNYIFHPTFGPMRKALSAQPSRLKLLGLMACQSDKYYRSLVEGANPRIDLVLSHSDVEVDEGEQIQIGIINAILAKKCRKDVEKSLAADVDPTPGHVVFTRK